MASEFHHRRAGVWALIGSLIVALVVAAGALTLAQMSGCCGGAPTHGCKFVESNDAAHDVSSDAPVPCGFQICQPGVTTCCLESDTEPPIRCIPVTQICRGPSATCAGDENCPGQHCCGTFAPMKVSCQTECSGDPNDRTVRICRTDDECPIGFPTCTAVTISGVSLFICQ